MALVRRYALPSAIELRGDPLSSLPRLGDFVGGPLGLDFGGVSVDYRHRSVGHWVFEGVKHGPDQTSFTAERFGPGGAIWPKASFSVASKESSLEVQWNAGADSAPRATAKYLMPDARAAEWIVVFPHQALGSLRRALSLGAAAGDDPARLAGTLSWIVPSDPKLTARGSFRFVLDHWYLPPWPEASALTGSSGSVAASILPNPDGSFRLARVEVAAALFSLEGSGTLTPAGQPQVRLQAKGRRTCAELAEHLAPSRYRDAVRARPEAGTDTAGSVELELTVELSSGPAGSTHFRWHLTPGCGLGELTSP